MSEIKWIKMYVEMFDNKKIKFIRKNIPAGNEVSLLWCMLLCMAGKCNAGGYIFITESIPYTPESLCNELDFTLNTTRLALEALQRLNMISLDDKGIYIEGWQEYQSLDRMEEIKKLNRERKQKQRNNMKLIENVTKTVTQCHVIDKEVEKDIITAKNINELVTLYHKICTSLPTIIEVNDKRKAMIKARLKEKPNLDFWEQVFNKIEASAFLTGKQGDWKANFDWIFKNNTNYIKIMEGCYNKDNEIVKPVDLTHTKHRVEFETPLEALTRLENDRV